jgi:hypothetical protein
LKERLDALTAVTGRDREIPGELFDMKKNIFLTTAILFLFAAPSVSFAALPDKVYAAWYSVPETLDESVARADMKKIADIGFNAVFFPANVWEETVASVAVEPPSEQYLKSLGFAIGAARANGLKVAMTGFLLVRDGAWRGAIMPVSRDKWAESYAAAIGLHLDLAEKNGVDAFCVGSEMESLKKDGKTWKYVVAEARKRFSGQIGFNVNWWWNQLGIVAITNQMGWLGSLDFIGVSGYFELTDSNAPTRDQLAAAWTMDKHGENLVDQLAAIKAKYPGKKLYLWEIGYRSMDWTNSQPWNWGRKERADPEEQADCFAAFFSVFPNTALDGFAIWALDPGLVADELGYGFVGKPAEKVVRDFLGAAGK